MVNLFSVVALMCVMVSLVQPVWAMESMETEGSSTEQSSR
jgi:hypothetical protein